MADLPIQKLEWVPLYIDHLLSSPAWQDMKDFQRGWYIQLLLRAARSERLGYLPLDENLWRIAGAHSRPMWEAHKAEVMACFESLHDDGRAWIYNQRLLSVMQEQTGKYRKRSGTSPSAQREPYTPRDGALSSTSPPRNYIKAEVCNTCGGEGRVRRDSRLPGPRTRPCPDCGAKNHERESVRRVFEERPLAGASPHG